MGSAVELRVDYTAEQVRDLARRSSDADQTRRLLALAVIYEGGSRGEAAETGHVGRQIARDWVLAFNAEGS
jgi:transposase